jgi:hypothetical protein
MPAAHAVLVESGVAVCGWVPGEGAATVVVSSAAQVCSVCRPWWGVPPPAGVDPARVAAHACGSGLFTAADRAVAVAMSSVVSVGEQAAWEWARRAAVAVAVARAWADGVRQVVHLGPGVPYAGCAADVVEDLTAAGASGPAVGEPVPCGPASGGVYVPVESARFPASIWEQVRKVLPVSGDDVFGAGSPVDWARPVLILCDRAEVVPRDVLLGACRARAVAGSWVAVAGLGVSAATRVRAERARTAWALAEAHGGPRVALRADRMLARSLGTRSQGWDLRRPVAPVLLMPQARDRYDQIGRAHV